MNKRQIKKRIKIVNERVQFFNKHIIISSGRRSGKTYFYKKLYNTCCNKKYKSFKIFKKVYNKLFLSVDLSNGKDYSIETTYKVNNGIFNVIKTRIVS